MDSSDFYARLPVQAEFGAIARAESYAPLPDDWVVLISDLEGSTAAIREGRYKEVNLLGASSIMAVINAVRPVQVPFVFGGDGASLAVPESVMEAAAGALLATSDLARGQFGLSMRVGRVPVRDIRAAGRQVLVAKVAMSESGTQAAFAGGGLQQAEAMIKNPASAARYLLAASGPTRHGDFNGLECRWSSIPSPHGEVVTLLVEATVPSAEHAARIYQEVIAAIERVYGRNEAAQPVRESGLKLTLLAEVLGGEATMRTAGRGRWRRARLAWIQFETLIGKFVMAAGIRARGIDWGRYKQDVIANTDYRKFDDRLRHVLSGAPGQRQQLEAWLHDRFERGELIYGMHAAATATMTCLILERASHQHIHFIDGSDGGYAVAATELKRRMRERAKR